MWQKSVSPDSRAIDAETVSNQKRILGESLSSWRFAPYSNYILASPISIKWTKKKFKNKTIIDTFFRPRTKIPFLGWLPDPPLYHNTTTKNVRMISYLKLPRIPCNNYKFSFNRSNVSANKVFKNERSTQTAIISAHLKRSKYLEAIIQNIFKNIYANLYVDSVFR